MGFVPGIRRETDGEKPAAWFVFSEGKVIIRSNRIELDVPRALVWDEFGMSRPLTLIYFGEWDDVSCFAVEISADSETPAGMELIGLRRFLRRGNEELSALASHASQILHWDRTNRFCGRCGSPTKDSMKERVKECTKCALQVYPRISPAIIVSIRRGGSLLLARSQRHRAGLFSNIAGYVEPGESLEECVLREISEEVGIRVKNVEYFGSQSWPFPSSLMVAFTAEYHSGEVMIDRDELLDARWFSVNSLPDIPESFTISRLLIDHTVNKIQAESGEI